MAGTDNLKPARSKEEARERGKKGGRASGEARRRKKTMREALEHLLYHGEIPETTRQMLAAEGIDAEGMTHQMVITRSLIAKAESGDVQAYNAICAMIGEKPAENVNVGIPTSLTITYRGSKDDADFPDDESKLDLERQESGM